MMEVRWDGCVDILGKQFDDAVMNLFALRVEKVGSRENSSATLIRDMKYIWGQQLLTYRPPPLGS